MAIADTILNDRFEGCLLGLAIGDALGDKFEAKALTPFVLVSLRSSN